MNRTAATALLESWIESPSLRRHCRSVELVMEAYARKLGEDTDRWAMTGLLHDADYEKHPDQHPAVIVDYLREQGEEEMAYAISAHYTKWGVPYAHLLDKALLACDELTGFIIACAWVRPDKIMGMKPKSVRKKLKDKNFAAKVERDEIQAGVELLNVDLNEHIEFIIGVLQEHKEELGLTA
ncbi:MAG: HD domain-containing protein [Bacteroidota bacterium]